MFTPLDNPVWYALGEVHAPFRLELQENVRFYRPDYCRFGAFSAPADLTDSIDRYATQSGAPFFLVGENPGITALQGHLEEVVCDQMVLHDPIKATINCPIQALNGGYEDNLYALVNLVQPGYFCHRTPEMGAYFGIFIEGKLVAAAGERMKLASFTEISAVVTHPEFTGRGYAKQLVAHCADKIYREGKTPFLHVTSNNESAIGLYKKLGFRFRRKMSFWKVTYNRTSFSSRE